MKFIHTSDIYYGIVPDCARDWAADRERAVKEVFSGIIKACADENADLLMICGDLYNGQPTEAELSETAILFSQIPDTKVIIIAGPDDHVIPNSPVTNFTWPKNVRYVREESLTLIPLDEAGTDVYARSMHKQGYADRLTEFPETDRSKINILMTAGGSFRNPLYDSEAVRAAGFIYGAFGGLHKHCELREDGFTAVYPGCPEPVSDRDTGEHGYYIGEAEGGMLRSLRFVPTAKGRYVTLNINITPATTGEELRRMMKEELRRRGKDDIFRLRLRGMCDPRENFDLTELRREWRISEIIDETEPKYDYRELFSQHPSDIIGLYIEKLYSPDAGETDRKALSYGINALLKTSEGSEG